MKLLQELVNPNTMTLTDTAQGVLVAIATAPTPQVGFETTNGSEKSVSSRNVLRSMGLVVVNGTAAALTRAGEEFAQSHDLVMSGQPTERGQAVLSAFNGRQDGDAEQEPQQQAPSAQTQQQPSEPNAGEDQQ
jgi:hypothetical protein